MNNSDGQPNYKHRIAFLTSGGDAPGMNAAIRAIVRMSIYKGCEAYAIHEGYKGLVEGGDDMIRRIGWNEVANIIGEGGTVIKSSRCPEFIKREYRKKAALNLVKKGIDKLIVIGGDGSLTGADTFRNEWPSLLKELTDEGEIDCELANTFSNFMVVGIVGSIDNDMVGTELTIGANSSLHRIIEAIDCIHSTAASHQRAFVIEVMGRHCGWLALNAAISCAADWLLIPEQPPQPGWEKAMWQTIANHRALGRSTSIIIIAEGAVDNTNNPIKSEYVRAVLEDNGLDARVTTLGHIQRGGHPSAHDRYLGTLHGIMAVESILSANPSETSSLLVGINENNLTCMPLMECVKSTRMISKAMNECNFEEALRLRGPGFRELLDMWECYVTKTISLIPQIPEQPRKRIGILNCGAPAAGMNAATVGVFISNYRRGYDTIGIFNGFEGLLNGDYHVMERHELFNKTGTGGSMLGTNRTTPGSKINQIADRFSELNIDGLVIVGGFEAFTAAIEISKGAAKGLKSLLIPVAVIPATISNNVPGTEYSIGSDTALNVIVQSCDIIRLSASSSRKRLFVIDVHGGYCGYLCTMAAIIAGASRSYIHEEGISLNSLLEDVAHLRERFIDNKREGRLMIRNEFVSDTFTAEIISKIMEEESDGAFDSRWAILGHLQQGDSPSPLDRVRALKLATKALDHIYEGDSSCCVVGIKGPGVSVSRVDELIPQCEMSLRRPLNQWWMRLRPYLDILAHRF